jgi:hypothetical protein
LRKLSVDPTHLAYLISLAVFLKLLSLTGWTWPLAGVAALLPVAGGFLLHGALAQRRRTD